MDMNDNTIKLFKMYADAVNNDVDKVFEFQKLYFSIFEDFSEALKQTLLDQLMPYFSKILGEDDEDDSKKYN